MDIFKVNIFNSEGNVSKIIVFLGDKKIEETENIFSDIEKEYIENSKINPHYSKQQIHIDDSIRVIKNKILHELGINEYAYDELYLFGNIEHQPNMYELYNSVTHKDKIAFSDENMGQIAINLNIDSAELNTIEKRKNYLYEDLLQLQQNANNKFILSIPLGRKFAKSRDYLYSANPFGIFSKKTFYVPDKKNELISFENTLLMNYGKMADNAINLCLADDVFGYASKNEYNNEFIAELYYPLLFQKGIDSEDRLNDEKQQLIKASKLNIDKQTSQLYEMVDLYYNIFENKKDVLNYEEQGIVSFNILFHTELNVNIPLEIIFKNIHVSKTIPLIKYNPGSMRENIYRLYSEKISKNGKKIPLLNESSIYQLVKKMGKVRQMSLYVQSEYMKQKIEIFIDLDNNGNIHVHGDFINAVSQEDLNTIIETSLNPVIQNINGFLQQSGYTIKFFKGIDNEKVEVIYMKYVTKIIIKKDIVLNKYSNGLSSIFNIVDTNINTGAHLIFKRVDNYKEMDEQRILIKRVYDETQNLSAILNALMNTYGMDEAAANSMVMEYFNDFTEVRGKIIDNPGFPVLITMDPLENKLIIDIENITSIHYIKLLYMYIDSFLRITQADKTGDSSHMYDKQIKLFMNSKPLNKTVDETKMKNVIAMHAVVAAPLIKNGEENEDMEDDHSGAMFYSDDEDEDEEEDEDVETTVEPDKEEPDKEESAEEESVEEESAEEESVEEESVEPVEEEPVKKESAEPVEKEPVEKSATASVESSSSPGGIFYSDSSSQENENSSSSSSSKTGGMTEESPPLPNKIDGMKLSNPNIFEERIKSRDRNLFLTKDGNYSAYSRSCESNIRRQPVILTDNEKKIIDEHHKGSYNQAIRYGSDPDKRFWYICPRYWCLNTQTSLTEEQVKSGVCGKVIPRGATSVPPGHYVYEFNHPEEHQRKDGTYIEHFPGFLDKKKHSDGYCLPCCFSKWDSEYMRKRRQICNQDATTESVTEKNQPQKLGNYIMGIDKYPLDKNRWGFLPFSVQSFLQTNNADCVTKNNPAIIRPDASCLLRYGVERSRIQSFVSCIADVYAYINKLEDVPTLSEMKNILAESISLDIFLQYHNGSLVSVFKPKIIIDEVDVDKYSDSEFMKSIDINNPGQFDFLEITIASYENFIKYLKSEDAIIDHSYLWDCITQPNPKLLKDGVNLVIMELSNKDITDNMEVLCPTNSQSSLLYDSRKKTLILLKHAEYYEPIYLYNDNPNLIVKTFDEHNSPKNIKKILTIIQKSTQTYCSARPSLPAIYEFKTNISAKDLSSILKREKYFIESQVLNYQNKVIGFVVKQHDESKSYVFVPTLPSAIVSNIKRKYMEDPSIWNDYKTTVKELNNIHAATEGRIRCKPTIKVIEDNLIVGILTETNQFVQINNPIENTMDDGLIPINETNYTIADTIITNTNKVDTERVETVKKIKLESQFYNVFRGIIRILMNDYINRHFRKSVLELIENRTLMHKEKIRKMETLLKRLAKNKIIFADIDMKILMELDNIQACSTDCGEKAYCITTEKNECQFIVPKTHLVSGVLNEQVYYARIADELLRYKRVQLFMLYPKTYLNIGHSEYKINSNELLLLQSALNSEYFKDMEVFNTNKYIQNVDFNTAIPSVSQKYTNEPITLAEQNVEIVTEQTVNECIHVIRDVVGNPTTSLWKRIFSNKKFSEIVFNNTPHCSFQVLLYILQDKLQKLITIDNLKVSLWNAYSKYFEKYSQKILSILKKQGKGKLLENVLKNKTSFESVIFSESYYLTDLDIWMIADKFNLSIVLFSSTKLGGLIETIDWLLLGGELSQPFYFIRSPQNIKSNSSTGYQLITPAVPLSEVNEFYLIVQNKLRQNTDTPQENLINISKYLEQYVYIKK